MATMFISGTQDVAIVAPLDDSVIFIDASTLTGGLSVAVGRGRSP